MLKNSSSSTGTDAWLAGSVAPSAKTFFERPVSSSTYFSPSAERGRMTTFESTGTAPAFLSSFSVSLRPDLAVGEHDRRHVGHDADAEAARAHLVALDQVGAVGHEHVELARGHERQPVVGVVGQEDGHDEDERGHRPDRARGWRRSTRWIGGRASWGEQVVEEPGLGLRVAAGLRAELRQRRQRRRAARVGAAAGAGQGRQVERRQRPARCGVGTVGVEGDGGQRRRRGDRGRRRRRRRLDGRGDGRQRQAGVAVGALARTAVARPRRASRAWSTSG